MTRDLDKVGMDVSGNSNLMLSLDESEDLTAYTDTDGNGTYETKIDTVMRVRVLDEEKTATIEAALPEGGTYLIFAQYDTNGKQLCTELVKADKSGKVYHTVALEDGAEIFKGFILDTNWSPLKEAIIEIV